MAKRVAAKPASKSAVTTAAAKRKAPVKRSAVKAAPVAESKPTAVRKPVTAAAPTVEAKPVAAEVAPAPQAVPEAKPQPKAAAAIRPAVQVTKIEASAREVAEDYQAMGKAAIDAYMQSSNLFAETFGAINREIMAFAQATMESNLEAARAMAGASSLEEVVDLQAKHSQKSIDSFLAESAKLTELSVELANGSIEPLQSNFKVTVEKFLKPVAA